MKPIRRYLLSAAVALPLVLVAHAGPAIAECLTILNECSGDPSGTCSVTGAHSVDNGCDLDFETRDVTVTGNLDFATGHIRIEANSLTVSGTGNIHGTNGSVEVTTPGSVTVASTAKMECLTTPDYASGGIVLNAASVTVNGIVRAIANSNVDSPGGYVEINQTGSGGWVDFESGSTLSAHGNEGSGGYPAAGGVIAISAEGYVEIAPTIDVSGGAPEYNGALDIAAVGNVTLTGGINGQANYSDLDGGNDGAAAALLSEAGSVTVSGTVTLNGKGTGSGCAYGSGGSLEITSYGAASVATFQANGSGGGDGGALWVYSGGNTSLTGTVTANGANCTDGGDPFGGFGGAVTLNAAGGNVTISSSVAAEGTRDGHGGNVQITAAGSVQNSATVSADGGTLAGGFGGSISVSADSATVNAALHANGRDSATRGGGGTIVIGTVHDMTTNASIQANGTSTGDDGGLIIMVTGSGAGGLAGAKLRVASSTVSADAGGCTSGGPCGLAGRTFLIGCDVQIDSAATVQTRGEGTSDNLHGVNNITARRAVTISGSVDARKQTAGTTDGKNIVKYRDSQSIGGTALKPAANSTVTQDTTLAPCYCGAGSTNGTSCSDGNACTQTDSCQSGTCTGSNPITCTASDQCHDAGTCNTGTGVCSNPAKVNGTSCSDGDACTQTDSCQSGTCTGSNPITCTASDQCHDAGTCNTGTGVCSNPAKANGTSCSDANACTQTDTCQSGTCTGSNPVECTASDQCHDAGTCDTGTGECSDPAKANGTSCSDGDECTDGDECVAGECVSGGEVCELVPLTLVRTIAPPAAGAYFGAALARLDADTLIVGAPFDYSFASLTAGVVYLYDVDTGTIEQTYANPDPEENGEFGLAVAALDGSVLVGAPQNDVGTETDAGKAYVFSTSSTTPTATYEAPTPISLGRFGYGVGAIGADPLIVHKFASEAYRIDATTSTITTYTQPSTQDGKWGDFIRPVGSHVAIGDQEAAKVFLFDADDGTYERTLTSSGLTYGFSGVESSGSLVLGGASGTAGVGSIDTYDPDTGSLIDSIANPDSGASWWASTVAVAGPRMLASAPDTPGTVYVLDPATHDLLQTLANPESGTGWFGWAMVAMGNSVAIGAPAGDGAVLIYAPCGDGSVDPGETCDDGNTTSSDGCSASCQTE
jgi:cysteine-rich repeat protein